MSLTIKSATLAIVFWNFNSILVLVRFATSKTKLEIQYNKQLGIRAANDLTHDLRKLEKTTKISNFSAWSPIQKMKFSNSCQKVRKSRYQISLVPPSYTGSPHTVPNTLSVIAAIPINQITLIQYNLLHGKICLCTKERKRNLRGKKERRRKREITCISLNILSVVHLQRNLAKKQAINQLTN